MKNISFLILICLLIKCSNIKQFMSQEDVLQNSKTQLLFENNFSFIQVTINETPQNLIFDTGSTFSAINDNVLFNNIRNEKSNITGSAKAADGNSFSYKKSALNLKNELFDWKNKIFAIYPISIENCNKNSRLNGIAGLDVFGYDNNKILLLAYSSNVLQLLDKSELNSIITEYTEIKSMVNYNSIYVFFKIKNVEYKFHFDTGYTGNITIPFDKTLNFTEFKSVSREGIIAKTYNGYLNGEETHYENVPIYLNNSKVFSKITVSNGIKAQNVGLKFIKAFDWIIDFKQKKVFYKKNLNSIENLFNTNVSKYIVSIKNKILTISLKQKNANEFKIGNQIYSINHQKITDGNICEMQDLLNNTADWKALNIVVK